MSKSRAAPLKQLTLPRLELKAAVLAAKLSSFIKISLSLDCTVQLWSGSQIVLHWIASHKPLQVLLSIELTMPLPNFDSLWYYIILKLLTKKVDHATSQGAVRHYTSSY